ncbi:MAG: AAA family ATPase, partial [bacterium]|nr:AAA family ATPase [bacterium]
MNFTQPYPGLRPFAQAEAPLFFGRDAQVDQLLEKLQESRFISVVGLSGCGKSSLVRAGLIPALGQGLLDNTGSRWRAVTTRPGSRPMQNLAEALLKTGFSEREQPVDADALPFLLAALRRGPLSLPEIFRRRPLPESTSLLILVDQFEELFRYHREGGRDESEAFTALLLAAAQQTEIPIYIVTTMRSDFIGDCALFFDLPETMNRGQFLTPRLSRDQQREVIVKPAALFNGSLEPRLVNTLLNEMGSDPDQLPVLQHCLMRMWSLTQALNPGTELTLACYETVGGLRQALSQHADEAYAELDGSRQEITKRLFRYLSERDSEGHEIRRPRTIEELAEVSGAGETEVIAIIETFRQGERCFLTPDASIPLGSDSLIDISHESLIQQWRQMKGWVDEESDSAEMYRRLEKTAFLWKKDKAALWGPPDLDLALQWKAGEQPTAAWARRYGEHFEPAMDFLEESRQAREARLRQEEEDRRQKLEQAQKLA